MKAVVITKDLQETKFTNILQVSIVHTGVLEDDDDYNTIHIVYRDENNKKQKTIFRLSKMSMAVVLPEKAGEK